MEYRYKRIVVGRNSEGKSAVLTTTSDNVQKGESVCRNRKHNRSVRLK